MNEPKSHYTGLIKKYLSRLPLDPNGRIISLGEGKTPLIRCHNIDIANQHDVDLYLKFEGLNPTGSFKDRGMTVAVTKAVQDGSKAIICASTGNTSAAAALTLRVRAYVHLYLFLMAKLLWVNWHRR